MGKGETSKKRTPGPRETSARSMRSPPGCPVHFLVNSTVVVFIHESSALRDSHAFGLSFLFFLGLIWEAISENSGGKGGGDLDRGVRLRLRGKTRISVGSVIRSIVDRRPFARDWPGNQSGRVDVGNGKGVPGLLFCRGYQPKQFKSLSVVLPPSSLCKRKSIMAWKCTGKAERGKTRERQ